MESRNGDLAGGETGRVTLMEPRCRCCGQIEVDVTESAGTPQQTARKGFGELVVQDSGSRASDGKAVGPVRADG